MLEMSQLANEKLEQYLDQNNLNSAVRVAAMNSCSGQSLLLSLDEKKRKIPQSSKARWNWSSTKACWQCLARSRLILSNQKAQAAVTEAVAAFPCTLPTLCRNTRRVATPPAHRVAVDFPSDHL